MFDDWTDTQEHGKCAPGVWYFGVKETKDATLLTRTRICSPLYIEAITRDEIGINFGRMLRFRTTDGKSVVWAMPMSLLAGSGEELRAIRLDRGAEIYPHGKSLLPSYLFSVHPELELTSTSRVGWHNVGAFVLPDKSYGRDSAGIVFQSGEREHGDYGVRGTLDGWQTAVAALAVGNPTLALGLSAAFVGPLLAKVRAENGGLHLVGESSEGKTTIVQAAVSVWGSPQHMRTWNGTANGFEGVAELFNDNLLVLDEINQCDAHHIGQTAYSLLNGKGKQRADRSGLARASKSWRLFLLSTGERSIGTRIAEAGEQVKAAQEVRLVDLPVKRRFGAWDKLHGLTDGAAFADAIKQTAAAHYGHAGRAFLERLVEDGRDWPATWEQYKAASELAAQSADGQDQRVATRFALIALAGEIATEYGVLPWPVGMAGDAATTMFKTYTTGRVAGNREPQQIVERVSGFINRNEARFKGPAAFGVTLPPRDRAGWHNGDGVFEFTAEALKEATIGFDFRHVLDALANVGALPTNRGRHSKSKRLSDGRFATVYPVNSDKLTL